MSTPVESLPKARTRRETKKLKERRDSKIEVEIQPGLKSPLESFNVFLDKISFGIYPEANIFEYYGPPGMGKSHLIEEERLLCREERGKDKIRTTPIHIDFEQDQERKSTYMANPINILQDMVSQLKDYNPDLNYKNFNKAISAFSKTTLPTKGLVEAYAEMDQESRLYQRPPWLEQQRNVVIEFIKLMNSKQENGNPNPTVLFFDHTNKANIELVDWMEEWVVNPLAQIPQVGIVWSATRPWRWKRPEVRRHLSSTPLDVLDENGIVNIIESDSANPINKTLHLGYTGNPKHIAPLIHSVTGGYSGATNAALNELNSLVENKNIDYFVPEHKPDLLQSLSHAAFADTQKRIDFSVDQKDVKEIIPFMGLVRLFDTNMIKSILTATGKKILVSTDNKSGDLMLSLKKTGLLTWEKGYTIHPALAKVFQEYFFHNDLAKFIEIQKAAISVYEDWLNRDVDNRAIFLTELFWHSALLQIAGSSTPSITEIINDQIPRFIKKGGYWLSNSNLKKDLDSFVAMTKSLKKDITQFNKEKDVQFDVDGLLQQILSKVEEVKARKYD